MFVFNLGPKRQGRMLSVWEVVRKLEGISPGESELMRRDLLLLILLNGNDYLPKARRDVLVLWREVRTVGPRAMVVSSAL